jgi:hypothetical protein
LETRVTALEEANRELNSNLIELARTTAEIVGSFEDICARIDMREEVAKIKADLEKRVKSKRDANFRFTRERARAKSSGNVTPLPVKPRQIG